MTQIYRPYTHISMINDSDDYGQFWDTETQRPIIEKQHYIMDNNEEYDYYIDNYELHLTKQEHMIELGYDKIDHGFNVFSTIGFIVFIVKAVSKYIYK